jgi:hypothetical protein
MRNPRSLFHKQRNNRLDPDNHVHQDNVHILPSPVHILMFRNEQDGRYSDMFSPYFFGDNDSPHRSVSDYGLVTLSQDRHILIVTLMGAIVCNHPQESWPMQRLEAAKLQFPRYEDNYQDRSSDSRTSKHREENAEETVLDQTRRNASTMVFGSVMPRSYRDIDHFNLDMYLRF